MKERKTYWPNDVRQHIEEKFGIPLTIETEDYGIYSKITYGDSGSFYANRTLSNARIGFSIRYFKSTWKDADDGPVRGTFLVSSLTKEKLTKKLSELAMRAEKHAQGLRKAQEFRDSQDNLAQIILSNFCKENDLPDLEAHAHGRFSHTFDARIGYEDVFRFEIDREKQVMRSVKVNDYLPVKYMLEVMCYLTRKAKEKDDKFKLI